MKFIVGDRYNWKHDSKHLLVYMGKALSNGWWHQFALVDAPGVCWCEVRDADLTMFEETK